MGRLLLRRLLNLTSLACPDLQSAWLRESKASMTHGSFTVGRRQLTAKSETPFRHLSPKLLLRNSEMRLKPERFIRHWPFREWS
ncbi:hypothetical protein AGR1B_Lc10042 [Agrobacterium fabacearum S56]|nr:hypothetical protein AGR1B_Lc10042 [Agrobacterium fabacearum S56]